VIPGGFRRGDIGTEYLPPQAVHRSTQRVGVERDVHAYIALNAHAGWSPSIPAHHPFLDLLIEVQAEQPVHLITVENGMGSLTQSFDGTGTALAAFALAQRQQRRLCACQACAQRFLRDARMV
jgi:hypothetical protein